MKHYYYLHTNGDLIHKPAAVVDSDPAYFSGPFVRRVWAADTEDRKSAWLILVEASALGASPQRIRELADKWHCNRDDLPDFLVRHMQPTPEQCKGLRVFIADTLNLNPETVFDEIAAMGKATA